MGWNRVGVPRQVRSPQNRTQRKKCGIALYSPEIGQQQGNIGNCSEFQANDFAQVEETLVARLVIPARYFWDTCFAAPSGFAFVPVAGPPVDRIRRRKSEITINPAPTITSV